MTEKQAIEPQTESSLTLSLLGTTQLSTRTAAGEARVVLTSGKPLALLAFLHCAPAQTASREQLLELLWSDAEPDSGRHTLRQTLWYIKRKLGLDPLSTNGDGVRIEMTIASDRNAFLRALDQNDPELALHSYTGDFFPEFAAPGGASFEQWADVERTRLRGLFIGAASRVVQERLRKGRARDALVVSRRAVELAPRQQSAWRLVLESYLAANDAVGAAVEADRLQQWLEADDIEPDAATTQLLRAVRTGATRSDAVVVGTTATPAIQAELVGRETAFAELLAAFDDARRGRPQHVHVSAPAGFGKSRLLDGLAARLRANRTRVVSRRGTPAERTLPYAFSAHLVSALVQLRGAAAVSPDAASTLVALAPSASNHLRAEPDRSTGDEALRRRSLALTELVATLAHDTPLVLLVDDVHWIDHPSRVLLATLATRLDDAPVLLVTAARSADRFIDDTPNARRIALDPLTVDDVGALLMSIGELPTDAWADAFVAALHATSGGSPLLILETLQLVMEREQLVLVEKAWRAPNPDALIATLGAGKALQQRVSSLTAAARDTLLRLAVTGTAVETDALSILLAADGRDALSVLEVRGLVTRIEETWRVAHDEIAECAIALASDADRARANQAAAEYLERTADGELTRLLRAGFHRARANDLAALDRVFLRAVRSANVSGDHRAIEQLGREALGPNAAERDVSALLSRMPWSVRTRPQRWAAGGVFAASALMLVAALATRVISSEPPVDVAATLLVGNDANAHFARLRFDMRDLARVEPLAVSIEKTPLLPPSVLDSMSVEGQLASGDFVGAGMLSTRASDGMDLYRSSKHGGVQVLRQGKNDQSGSVVSPDGKYVAYLTAERSESEATDIAILDVATDSSRQITSTAENEGAVAWSTDGSRLAYVRTPMDRGDARVCWTAVDGSASKCLTIGPQFIPIAALAWAGEQSVLVTAQRDLDSRLSLFELNFARGAFRLVDSAGADYRADPAGRVVVCRCHADGYTEDVIAVFDPLKPEHKRALSANGEVLRALPRLMLWRRQPEYVNRIVIDGAPQSFVGYSVRYRASAHRADSSERSAPLVQWTSLDPAVGRVDSSGIATMLAPGRLRLVASVGGWRADTLAVDVRPTVFSTVLSEDWHVPNPERRWFFNGRPLSSVELSNAATTLHVNGDGRLNSGVISRIEIPARGGVGVRARVRAPLNVARWQSINVALTSLASNAAIDAWVHEDDTSEPAEWRRESASRSCSMRAPRLEGGPYLDAIALVAAGKGAVFFQRPAPISDGRWHTITMQIMPDGRCALAIDGVHVATSDNFLNVDRPMRVRVEGQSMGTTVEVGLVEAWTGIATDVEWQALKTLPAPPKRESPPSATNARDRASAAARPTVPTKPAH